MKRSILLSFMVASTLFLTGCGHGEVENYVDNRGIEIPIDTNIAYAYKVEPNGEKYVLYYADPRPEEHGQNRIIRIDYRQWKYRYITCNGSNPHSVDRAGWSNRFYVRTQNSYSFDIVDFDNDTVQTVDMNDTHAKDGAPLHHKPRAIGAYNAKYNIQLLSVKNRPAVDVIDVTNRSDDPAQIILTVLGDNHTTIASGSATGHALWFDEDHCGVIDRVNNLVWVYRVEKNTNGQLTFTLTQKYDLKHHIHALERIDHATNEEDAYLFYATYEGDATQNPPLPPAVAEIRFDPLTETLEQTREVVFPESTTVIDGIPPITHHLAISYDGRYIVVPDFDGSVYIVDRRSFKVVKKLQAGLGAAHVNFDPTYDMAIVTSHFDRKVTLIDLKALKVITRVDIYGNSSVTFDPNEKHLLQPHFSYVDPNGRYFYTFATQIGDFVKIDLETGDVVDRLHTGGAPEQAHS